LIGTVHRLRRGRKRQRSGPAEETGRPRLQCAGEVAVGTYDPDSTPNAEYQDCWKISGENRRDGWFQRASWHARSGRACGRRWPGLSDIDGKAIADFGLLCRKGLARRVCEVHRDFELWRIGPHLEPSYER